MRDSPPRPLSFAAGLDLAVDFLSARPADLQIAAVDGHSAAGKSTFAAALASRIGAALVPGDDFYRVMDENERARLSAEEGMERYFDWERMRDEVLVRLRAGGDARYRAYDWESGLLSDEMSTILAASVVVVDGVFVSRPQLSELVDLSILVETPADVRWARQLERGDSLEWLRRWDAAERLFLTQVRPRESFDLVVSGVEPG